MPYNIIKSGRKYELYLIDGNKLLGTHTSKKKAEEQIKAIEINKTGRKNNGKKVGKYIYYISDKPEKKLMTIVNGKKIYFGQMGYMHYKDKTGLLDKSLSHLDKDRRNRYIARASKIVNKEGELTALNPESPNYHAINILW